MKSSRDIILARRARFVATALASSGLAASSALGQPNQAPPAAAECEQNPEACRPQICLSDDYVEGELIQPPGCTEEALKDGTCEAAACLSVALPECPKGEVALDDGSCEPAVCLSVAPCPDGWELDETHECVAQVCLSIIQYRPFDSHPQRHDGMYLRIALGPGYLGASSPGATAHALSYEVDLGWGLGLAQGLTSGAFASLSHAPSSSVAGDVTDESARTRILFGPFFDYYPEPEEGLHFGAALGAQVLARAGGDEKSSGVGPAAALWLGYDLWIGDEWSLGAALRGHAGLAWTRGDTSSQRVFTRGAGLVLSALWH